MLATVKAGLAVKEGVLPDPIKLHSKAGTHDSEWSITSASWLVLNEITAAVILRPSNTS